jgi:hypothetical protein
MKASNEIRKALVQAEDDRKAANLVIFELIAVGIVIGYAKGPWFAGLISGIFLFFLFMIPYIRVIAYFAVSSVWALLAVRLIYGADVFSSDSEATGPAVAIMLIVFLMCFFAHFAFKRHMDDLSPRNKSAAKVGVQSDRVANSNDLERDCPICAERIKAKAKKCRYCGAMVTPNVGA